MTFDLRRLTFGAVVSSCLCAFVAMMLLPGCSTLQDWWGDVQPILSNNVDQIIHVTTNALEQLRDETGTVRRAVVGYCRSVDPAKYDGWYGSLPDTDVDGEIIAQLCRDTGMAPGDVVVLTNHHCIADNFERAVLAAAAGMRSNDLLVVFFSGHGGQVDDPYDPGETDGKSETLCFYDGQYIDNRFGALLERLPPMRIWLGTDTCNSGSNYRQLPPAERPKLVLRGFVPRNECRVQVIHWGGCADGESSQSTGSGGVFTGGIVDAYTPDGTYTSMPPLIKRAMRGSGQIPYFGEHGPVSESFRQQRFLH